MRVFFICLRTALLAFTLVGLSVVASGQVIPPITERPVGGEPGRVPYPDRNGPRSVGDPERLRRDNRDPLGGYVYPARRVTVGPAERKLTAAQKRALYPSATEKAAFAALLRQDATGMARLLPFCAADARILDVRGSCAYGLPRIPGRGTFYSFKSENHEAKAVSDLMLIDNEFRVGFADRAVGTIATLGDAPLDELTLQSSALAPLLRLAPAKTLDELVSIYEQNRTILASAQHAYRMTAPAQLNTTYVMRSTAYNPKQRKPSDVIVAFRVTRQDADGSVTILWKQLRTPKG